jgi:hypothetical protein
VVTGGLEPELGGALQRRPHHRGRRAEELDAVGARRRHRLDPAPRLLRRAHAARNLEIDGKGRIGGDARCHDFVGGAASLLGERPAQAVESADVAHGGDAVRQPELVDVLGRRHAAGQALRRKGDVGVGVDETGERVHAVGVDLVLAGYRPPAVPDGHARISDAADLGDAPGLDHQIDRAHRRRAGAVDQGDTTHHQGARTGRPPLRAAAAAPATPAARRHPSSRQ